jgi:hypothetical protein
MSNVRSPQGSAVCSRASSSFCAASSRARAVERSAYRAVFRNDRRPAAFTSPAQRFACARSGRPSFGGRLTAFSFEVAPRLLPSRAARPLASSSPASIASSRAGARRSGEVGPRGHRSGAPSLPSCKPFKHTGRIEQVCRAGPWQHRASSTVPVKARRMREPNPSIERTSSSQLRWPAAAAHVER